MVAVRKARPTACHHGDQAVSSAGNEPRAACSFVSYVHSYRMSIRVGCPVVSGVHSYRISSMLFKSKGLLVALMGLDFLQKVGNEMIVALFGVLQRLMQLRSPIDNAMLQ